MTQGTFDFSENGDTPLREVRDYFFSNVDEGLTCPCCGQFAKIYKRKLNRTMVKALRALHNAGGTLDWVHSQSILSSNHYGGDVGKTALWGLVRERRIPRKDGGRAGWWMVTPEGLSFLRGTKAVPKYACVYNGRLQMLKGDPVTINDVAREFRLDDLMNDK
jgi:hypothetical protein